MNNFIINIYGGTVHINNGATEGVQNIYNCPNYNPRVINLQEDEYEEIKDNALDNKNKL